MAGKRTLEGEESNEFTWKKLKGNANPGIYPARERFDDQYDNFMVQRRNANYMNINMAAADAEYLRHPVNYALNKQFHLMSDSMSSNNGSNGFMYPFDRPNFSENNAPNGMDVKSYPNFFAMQRPQFNPQHQYLNFHNSQAEQPINRLPMEFLNNHANMYRQHMPFRTELIKPDSVPMFMNLVNSNNSVNVSQEMIPPYQKVNGYRSPNCKPFTNPFLHFKPTFNEPYPRPMNGFTNEFDNFSTNFSAMSKSNPDYQNFNRSFIDSSVAENKTSNSNCDKIQPSELEKKVNKNIKQSKKDKHIENSPVCNNGWLVSSSYTVASSHSASSLVSSPILKPSSMLNSMPTSALSSKSHWNPGLPARNEKLVNELDVNDKSAMKNNIEVNENHSESKHLKTNFKNDVELNEKHHLMQHQSLKSPELHDNKFEEYIQPDPHSSLLFQQQAYFSRNQELPQDIVAKRSMPAVSSDLQPHLQPTALKQHMQQSQFEKQKHLLHMPFEQHLQQPSFSQHSQQLLQHPTKQVTSKQPVQQTSPQNHSQKVFNQYSNCSPQNHCETLSHQPKNHQNLQHKQHHLNQQQHSVNSNIVDRQLSPKQNLQQRIHQPYLPEQCSTKLNQSLHHEAQRPCNTPSQIDQATLTHPQRTATVNHHLSPKLHHHMHPQELVSPGRSNNSLMHKNAPQPVMGHHHDPSQHLPRAPQQFQPQQHFSPRYKSVQQLSNPHFQPHHSLLQHQEQHRNASEIHLRLPQRQQHFPQSVPYQHNLTQGVQKVHFPDDNTRDPMRMIEKLSNRHFNTYESQFIFGNDKINLHGCSEHENNFTSNRASALQHNSSGTHAMVDSTASTTTNHNHNLTKPKTPQKSPKPKKPKETKPKRNKKDSEREQYEMWLNERKKLLIERINELERVKEQGMNESQNQRAVYNKSNSSQEPNNQQVEHQQRFTADDFNEDIKHLNSAIEQMKKDLHEHEMIMKMFFTSNTAPANNNRSTSDNAEKTVQLTCAEPPRSQSPKPSTSSSHSNLHHQHQQHWQHQSQHQSPGEKPSQNFHSSKSTNQKLSPDLPRSTSTTLSATTTTTSTTLTKTTISTIAKPYDSKQLEETPLPDVVEPVVLLHCPIPTIGFRECTKDTVLLQFSHTSSSMTTTTTTTTLTTSTLLSVIPSTSSSTITTTTTATTSTYSVLTLPQSSARSSHPSAATTSSSSPTIEASTTTATLATLTTASTSPAETTTDLMLTSTPIRATLRPSPVNDSNNCEDDDRRTGDSNQTKNNINNFFSLLHNNNNDNKIFKSEFNDIKVSKVTGIQNNNNSSNNLSDNNTFKPSDALNSIDSQLFGSPNHEKLSKIFVSLKTYTDSIIDTRADIKYNQMPLVTCGKYPETRVSRESLMFNQQNASSQQPHADICSQCCQPIYNKDQNLIEDVTVNALKDELKYTAKFCTKSCQSVYKYRHHLHNRRQHDQLLCLKSNSDEKEGIKTEKVGDVEDDNVDGSLSEGKLSDASDVNKTILYDADDPIVLDSSGNNGNDDRDANDNVKKTILDRINDSRNVSQCAGSVPPQVIRTPVKSHYNGIKRWRNEKYGTWSRLVHARRRMRMMMKIEFRKAREQCEPVKMVTLATSVSVDGNNINNDNRDNSNVVVDNRCCMLCGSSGDAESNGPGRLLIANIDEWVHCNCSLWSHDVYETLDGTLVGSKRHINSMKHTGFCAVCARPGATVACFLPSCGQSFHLICARKQGMCFLENKTTYCKHHCPRHLLGTMIHDLSIKRRICCERNEIKQVARMLKEDEPENFFIRIGSLLVNNIGHLLPQHVQTFKFNTDVNIYPVGFKSTRFYWSYRNLHQRCQYHCSIEECSGEPLFKVKVVEHSEENVTFESNTCTGAWKDILDQLVELRRRHGLAHLFRQYITGEDLFGLNEPAIRKVIESLPGVELMTNVQMRYGKSSIYVLPLAVNPSGCVRTEPKSRTFFKRSHTLLSNFNAGGSSEKSTWMGSGEFSITQYMKQFTATKSQRYRSLRTEWRNNVYLRRSNIQGLGLFAARELEQFTMVIEYIGEIIRNEIAEIREKVYEQQNRGVYMFRLDENKVVDATMAGGPARYINHSCDPNCFTEVVATEKGEKIIIIAKRKIRSGEELSYDYKFNFEDEKSKIPCLCGAAKCMKWMN